MSETTDATAVAAPERVRALPQDIVAEILARVPDADAAFLFRCGVVCKQWGRLVADPDFLRRFVPEGGGRPSLLGFFVQRHCTNFSALTELAQISLLGSSAHRGRAGSTAGFKLGKRIPTGAPAVVPAPRSELGPRLRSLASFVRDDGGLLDRARPLMARGGLLLLRTSPGCVRDAFRLCVCNLLTGKLDVLPPLNTACFDGAGVRGYAVVTAADLGTTDNPAEGYSTFFQVLLIGVHRSDKQVHIHKFSSAAVAAAAPPNWFATPTKLFRRTARGSCGRRVAAVCCGSAHWLFQVYSPKGPILYILEVNLSTGQVCTTKLPFDIDPFFIQGELSNARLCSSIDARLSLIYIQDNHLVMWTRHDGDGGAVEWLFTQAMPVPSRPWVQLHRAKWFTTICVGEESCTAFLRYGSDSETSYVLDLQSGSTTEVAGWKKWFDDATVMPFEMNWPVFFRSRLCVQCI